MALEDLDFRFGNRVNRGLDTTKDTFQQNQANQLERMRLMNERLAIRSDRPQAFEAKQTQSYLPPQLRLDQIGDFLSAGTRGIGELIQRPGGLSPGVAEAILPRLSAESEILGQQFRNIRSEQAGAAARSGAPLSLKGAIDTALNVAQERAQRGIRREALGESEQLRRQDLGQFYQLLDTLLQFIQSGRGQATAGRQLDIAERGQKEQSQAAKLAALASIIGAFASASRFKEDFVPITSEQVLDSVG